MLSRLLLSLILLAAPLRAEESPNGPLRVDLMASGVMTTFLKQAATRFLVAHPDAEVVLGFPSSSTVIAQLEAGKLSFGATSRPLTASEKNAFRRNTGRELCEVPVAFDALRVIVNARNPLVGITLGQLDSIYSSAQLRGDPPVQNWDDLGLAGSWAGQPIIPWGGAPDFGTTKLFEAMVCWGAPSHQNVQGANIQTGIPSAVAADVFAIGYTCLGALPKDTRVVPVGETAAGPFVACEPSTVRSGAYPLRRELFLYLAPDASGRFPRAARVFADFLLSPDGQSIAAAAGFVPLEPEASAAARKRLSQD